MAQFDVHELRGATSDTRFVVDLQSDLLGSLDTRIVAPLRAIDSRPRIGKLNPSVEIGGARYMVSVPELAAVHKGELGFVVASLAALRPEFEAGLDLMLASL